MAAFAGTSSDMAGGDQGRRFVPTSAVEALEHYRAALLLWDLQKGLGGRAEGLEFLLERWRSLRDNARRAGILVVRSRHVAPPLELMDDAEVWRICRKQGVSSTAALAPYMQRDTSDVDYLEGFEPTVDELVIEKATPSLFVNTAADARLRSAGVGVLVLAGVATDIGIEFTARHALALGYFPIVVTDAVGAYSAKAQVRGIACLESFALLARSADITSVWGRL